jgi:hypothetical protein
MGNATELERAVDKLHRVLHRLNVYNGAALIQEGERVTMDLGEEIGDLKDALRLLGADPGTHVPLPPEDPAWTTRTAGDS